MLKFGNIQKGITALILMLSTLVFLGACGFGFSDNKDSGAADGKDSESVESHEETVENSSTNETNKEIIGDSKLVGAWSLVSLDNQGDYTGGIVYGYDADLYIMYNGQCYGSLIESLYNLEDDGDWINPAAAIDAENGEFTFKDVSVNGDATMELKATYTIADIEKSSVSEREKINVFYRDAKDDQLTIHFTGSLKVGPTDVRSIDFTAVYEKEGISSFKNEGILWAAMVGKWKDNYGNKWTFTPRKESEDLGFTMISDGKEYEGKSDEYVAVSIGSYEIDDKIVYLMNFNYKDEDMSDIYHAKIISFDGNELCLEQSGGQSLIFSK